jgi:hypothetical protein
MDEKAAQEVFDELLPALEALDTKCAAILQFLKDKGIASDDELVPYLEQAGNGSSVRWRVARVRINHLLSATKTVESVGGTPSTKAPEKIPEPAPNTTPKTDQEQTEKQIQGAQKTADDANAEEGVAPRKKGNS